MRLRSEIFLELEMRPQDKVSAEVGHDYGFGHEAEVRHVIGVKLEAEVGHVIGVGHLICLWG